ncbi:hypothetical protein B0A55_06504 [Friedmanniomyces simplex]|uniref:galacturonan 1,4-alpha-galacturonidase n=1 Tax=Friedmanniomyces simplex TaxID=329884 RepID=A0A4U0XG90_9PEZI|nr:hypothetical protein B0A55_06504 [Friedmanniomyces simplex]
MLNTAKHNSLALLALTSLTSAFQTCVVPLGGPGIDDSDAVRALLPNCSANAEIVFSSCTTYNISTPINFGTLSNVTISILGDLNLPASIPYVQSLVNATAKQSLHWFTIAGTDVTLQGNQNPAEGFVYPYGEQWWTAAQHVTPLGGLPLRPHGFSVNANRTTIRYMKVSKPIAWNFALSGSDYVVHDNWIDASYDLNTPNVFPFNTDGYDVKGTNVTFYNNHVFNGDDCVAVNNGAHNVYITDMICEGGHGISLSGVDDISNVIFNNITSRNSLYATRFKSSLDSTGNVSDVHWQNIYVLNATFPVFATSVYFDQNTNRGETPGVYPANSTATFIDNFSWTNVSGTINDMYPGDGSCVTDPCWYYVANATNTAGVTMQLLNGTASGVHLENINLLPIDGKGVSDTYCNPDSFTDGTENLGFVCANGPYKAT